MQFLKLLDSDLNNLSRPCRVMQGESEKDMGTYREYIENMKREWVGKCIKFDDSLYNVVDIDYNGFLLIDKKAQHTDTTAVEKHLVEVIEEQAAGQYLPPSLFLPPLNLPPNPLDSSVNFCATTRNI